MYDLIRSIDSVKEAAREALATADLELAGADHVLVQVRHDDLARLIEAAELQVSG